jgi:hypothetical protein
VTIGSKVAFEIPGFVPFTYTAVGLDPGESAFEVCLTNTGLLVLRSIITVGGGFTSNIDRPISKITLISSDAFSLIYQDTILSVLDTTTNTNIWSYIFQPIQSSSTGSNDLSYTSGADTVWISIENFIGTQNAMYIWIVGAVAVLIFLSFFTRCAPCSFALKKETNIYA